MINPILEQKRMFLKRYKYDILTFVFSVLLLFISFYLANNLKLLSLISFLILLLSLVVYIYLRTRDKDFYFLPFNKPGQDKDWIGRGTLGFVHNEKCFLITDSDVGYIFSKTSQWSDYQYETDFKIVNKCMSWIVRSVNLSNYVMFQCGLGEIIPHIRLSGQWIVLKNKDGDMNMKFQNSLSPDTWYRSSIVCEKRMIRIKLYDYKEKSYIFDRHWEIPNSLVVGFSKNEQNDVKSEVFLQNGESKDDENNIYMNQNIDFDFGSVGVRNWGYEKGLVKNIFIEKL